MRRAQLRWLSRIMIGSGIALLAFWSLALLHSSIGSATAIAEVESARAAPACAPAVIDPSAIDTSLWSEKRIAEFREALGIASEPPLAVIRIPRIGVEAPVFTGTDDVTLNRGVGWISGTAQPGTIGNIGIAGHRDGFFRPLKDIAVDDVIEVITREGQKSSYVVRELTIVTPSRVDVLSPSKEPSLTLVTCYPFYFIGSAPQRFIVHAVRTDPGS